MTMQKLSRIFIVLAVAGSFNRSLALKPPQLDLTVKNGSLNIEVAPLGPPIQSAPSVNGPWTFVEQRSPAFLPLDSKMRYFRLGGNLPAFDPTQDTGEATSKPADRERIDIVFDPEESILAECCEKIALIQTVQAVTVVTVDGHSGLKAVPPADLNSDWEFLMDDAITDGAASMRPLTPPKTWLVVDYHKGDVAPYLNGDDPSDTGQLGAITQNNTSAATATVIPSLDRDNKVLTKEGTVRLFFTTAALCTKGQEKGEFYEVLSWRSVWLKSNADTTKFGQSRISRDLIQPPNSYLHAINIWNENHKFNIPMLE